MSNYVSVILCRKCGSRYVDLDEWSAEGKGIIHCRSCNNREEIRSFTLGRACVSNTELQHARDSAAKKGKYEK